MGIHHLSYVYCDNCDEICPESTADDAKDARRMLPSSWTRRDGKDLCPNCSEG